MELLDKIARWLETLLSWGHLGFLGAFGGVANFYYLNATKNRKFLWGVLFANVVIAFFLGRALGSFISEENQFRDGIVMLFGFFSFPLVHVLESRVVTLLDRILPFGGK